MVNKSDSIGQLTAALIKAKREFKILFKNKSISYAGSPIKYIDLPNAIDGTEEALGNAGLCVFQTISPSEDFVIVDTVLSHESGEWISSTIQMPIDKNARNASQNYGGIVTYARRYSYMGILCISASDDLDGHLEQNTPIKTTPVTITKPTELTRAEVKKLVILKKLTNQDIFDLQRECEVNSFALIPDDKFNLLIPKIKD